MAFDTTRLERDLRAAVRGSVRFDAGSKAMYATGASNYRQVPVGVVLPADPEDAVAAVLWPAVRSADPGTLVLADGFSCRTQIAEAGSGRRAVHLAEVLAASVRGDRLAAHRPERGLAGGEPGERG